MSSLGASLALSQMFLLALPGLTVPLPCPPTKSTGAVVVVSGQKALRDPEK